MASNTKYTILCAYFDLISKKNIDKVTVKDVVEECGITRQTFYYHFQDLLDVIEWGFRRCTEESVQKGLQCESIEEALNVFLTAADQYRPLARKILKSQKKNQICDLVLTAIQNWLFEMIKEKCHETDYPIHELDFAIHFYSFAIAGSLYDIIWNDDPKLDFTIHQIITLMEPLISHFEA